MLTMPRTKTALRMPRIKIPSTANLGRAAALGAGGGAALSLPFASDMPQPAETPAQSPLASAHRIARNRPNPWQDTADRLGEGTIDGLGDLEGAARMGEQAGGAAQMLTHPMILQALGVPLPVQMGARGAGRAGFDVGRMLNKTGMWRPAIEKIAGGIPRLLNRSISEATGGLSRPQLGAQARRALQRSMADPKSIRPDVVPEFAPDAPLIAPRISGTGPSLAAAPAAAGGVRNAIRRLDLGGRRAVNRAEQLGSELQQRLRQRVTPSERVRRGLGRAARIGGASAAGAGGALGAQALFSPEAAAGEAPAAAQQSGQAPAASSGLYDDLDLSPEQLERAQARLQARQDNPITSVFSEMGDWETEADAAVRRRYLENLENPTILQQLQFADPWVRNSLLALVLGGGSMLLRNLFSGNQQQHPGYMLPGTYA